MRVAILSPLFESVPPRLYGGTERVVSNLCQGLSRIGIEVVLFASGDSTVEGTLVPVVDEGLRLRNPPVSDPAAYHFQMLATVAQMAGEFDIIHNHHDYWMLPLTGMTDTPLLTTLHGRLDSPECAAVLSSYPKSVYVSISDAQRAPLPSLRWLKTVHHGMDVAKAQYHPHPGKYLAFLGRISREKKPEWAVEIALRSGVPLKIAAKIEGPEGQHYYNTYVKPHVDGHFIEYIGEISETERSEFLGNALALVFPIDWPEPFGLVVIESLACGTPVLARPCGSVVELLQDQVTGYLDSNIQKLAQRVRDIPKISRLECRRWAETRFSLDRMTEDYVHVYRQLAAERIRPHRHRWDFLHTV